MNKSWPYILADREPITSVERSYCDYIMLYLNMQQMIVDKFLFITGKVTNLSGMTIFAGFL